MQGLIQSGNNVFVITGGPLPLPVASTASGSRPPVLRAHQYYLTREEIKRRLATPASEDTKSESTTFTVVDPKKQKIETDWSKLGSGNALKSTSTSDNSNIEDAEIQAALAASVKELQLPEPVPEPPSTDSPSTIAQLIVRFPSGTRQIRKFSLASATIQDVFSWLEYAAAKCVEPAVFLGNKSEYGLIGIMEKRGTKFLKRNGQFMFTNEQGVDPTPLPDNGSASLQSLGIKSGQDSFNLQY